MPVQERDYSNRASGKPLLGYPFRRHYYFDLVASHLLSKGPNYTTLMRVPVPK